MSKPGPAPITVEQARTEGWYRPNRNAGFCECGCGRLTPIAAESDRRRGWVKGEPVRFVTGHWLRALRHGAAV